MNIVLDNQQILLAVNVNKDMFGQETVALLIARLYSTLRGDRQATAATVSTIIYGKIMSVSATVRMLQIAPEDPHMILVLVNAILSMSGMVGPALSFLIAQQSRTVMKTSTPRFANARMGTIGKRVAVCLTVLI